MNSVLHDVCPDCGTREGWLKQVQFCEKCCRVTGYVQPNVTLVYYRAGVGCIERVVVVDGKAHVKSLDLNEVMGIAADICTLAARLMSRTVAYE